MSWTEDKPDAMLTSETDEWSTPPEFFRRLNASFGPFDLDPCCTAKNAKAKKFFTLKDNGLAQDWSGHRIFMNPPYGAAIGAWVEKAYHSGTPVVALLPSRCCTAWWHEFVMDADMLFFVRGRLAFGEGKAPAPFPSVVVLWTLRKDGPPGMDSMLAKAPELTGDLF